MCLMRIVISIATEVVSEGTVPNIRRITDEIALEIYLQFYIVWSI